MNGYDRLAWHHVTGESACVTVLLLCRSLSVQFNSVYHQARLIAFMLCKGVLHVPFGIGFKINLYAIYAFLGYFVCLLLVFYKVLELNGRFTLKLDSEVCDSPVWLCTLALNATVKSNVFYVGVFLKVEDWEGGGGLILYLGECGKFLLFIFYFKILIWVLTLWVLAWFWINLLPPGQIVLILKPPVSVFLFLAFTGTSQSVYWNMVWKLYRQDGPAGNCGT